MTAYDFTKFNSSPSSIMKASKYDMAVVAFNINLNCPENDYFRSSSLYSDAKNIFIDLTMSCDVDEAAYQMRRWMIDALAYAIDTRDLDWRMFFMAAYDLHESLISVKNR